MVEEDLPRIGVVDDGEALGNREPGILRELLDPEGEALIFPIDIKDNSANGVTLFVEFRGVFNPLDPG